MKAIHTEGPWGIDPRTSTRVVGPNGRGICSTGGYSNNQEDQEALQAENESNARLIAAAPDLLRALEALLPVAEDAINKLHDLGEVSLPAGNVSELLDAVAALAKAKGDTP